MSFNKYVNGELVRLAGTPVKKVSIIEGHLVFTMYDNSSIDVGKVSESTEFDTKTSLTSENGVQNKVITKYVNDYTNDLIHKKIWVGNKDDYDKVKETLDDDTIVIFNDDNTNINIDGETVFYTLDENNNQVISAVGYKINNTSFSNLKNSYTVADKDKIINSVVLGNGQTIENESKGVLRNTLINGYSNGITENNVESSIITGFANSLSKVDIANTVFNGYNNMVAEFSENAPHTITSSSIHGSDNMIDTANDSVVAGARNTVDFMREGLIVGNGHTVNDMITSSIVNGTSNVISGAETENNYFGGENNNVHSVKNSNINGQFNEVLGGLADSTYSVNVLINGQNNSVNYDDYTATDIVVFGEQNNILLTEDTKNVLLAGEGIMGSSSNQTIVGMYNNKDTDSLFAIGCGMGENDRKNALNIKKNGDIYINVNDNEVKLLDYINLLSSLSVKVVETLPTENISSETIYLKRKENVAEQNIFNEYLYINDSWELIGDTSVDLKDYAKKTDIPTKVSTLENDSKFITISDIDLSNYATKDELDKKENKVISLTQAEYDALETKDDNTFYIITDATSINSLQNILTDYALKSSVPTKVGQLENDSGYLTKHQDISNKADKADIPTKTSQLTNDSGYLVKDSLKQISSVGYGGATKPETKIYFNNADLPNSAKQLLYDYISTDYVGGVVVIGDSDDNNQLFTIMDNYDNNCRLIFDVLPSCLVSFNDANQEGIYYPVYKNSSTSGSVLLAYSDNRTYSAYEVTVIASTSTNTTHCLCRRYWFGESTGKYGYYDIIPNTNITLNRSNLNFSATCSGATGMTIALRRIL